MKIRIIYFLLFFISIWFFWDKIPEDILIGNTFIFALIGSFISFILIAQTFGNFSNLKELIKDTSQYKNKWYRKIAPFFVFPTFIYFFVLGAHYHSYENNDLQDNGIFTKALVLNGRSKKIRTGRFLQHEHLQYYLTLKYSTKDSIIKHEFPVKEIDFKSSIKGEKIDIIYSQNKVLNIQPLISDFDIKKFTDSHCRSLTYRDLILINRMNPRSVTSYLKKVHFNWNPSSDEKNNWLNLNKSEYLFKNENLTYTFPVNQNEEILQEIRKGELISKKGNISTFKKEGMIISIENTFSDMKIYHIVRIGNYAR